MRIIANKKVDMTDHEWDMYQEICSSSDRPGLSGKDLFVGLFEVSEDGIIMFVKPAKRQTTMEAYCFMTSLMMNQHLRILHKIVESLVRETRARVEEVLSQQKEIGND